MEVFCVSIVCLSVPGLSGLFRHTLYWPQGTGGGKHGELFCYSKNLYLTLVNLHKMHIIQSLGVLELPLEPVPL